MACISEDDKLLFSRLDDALYLCNKRYTPCFLGFLDAREQALVRNKLISSDSCNWRFYGGYEDAERVILAIIPEFFEPDDVEYPFTAVAFRYRKEQKLTHRDFLGSLLACGIRRDKIGDILCGDGLSVAFLSREIVPYVCEQIQCVGREGVTITPDYTDALPLNRTFLEIQDTVASPRLDAVVKALIRSSREEAAQLIRTGMVSVDHLQAETVSLCLTAPCTVSVRGHGRFIVDRFGPKTKKGRLQFLARKCI